MMDTVLKQDPSFPVYFVGIQQPQSIFGTNLESPIHHITTIYDLPAEHDYTIPSLTLVQPESLTHPETELADIAESLSSVVILLVTDDTSDCEDTLAQQDESDTETHCIAAADVTTTTLASVYMSALARREARTRKQNSLTQQLLTILQHPLESDSDIYQGLQAISRVLGAEGLAVFTRGTLSRLYSVNIDSTRNFRSSSYTNVQSDTLSAVIRARKARAFPAEQISKDKGLRNWLDVQRAQKVYALPVFANHRTTGAILVACDLPTVMLRHLEPVLALVVQYVSKSITQRWQQQQEDRKHLMSQMMDALIGTPSIEEIQEILSSAIEEIPSVRRVIIWQKALMEEGVDHYYCSLQSDKLEAALDELKAIEYFDMLIEDFPTDVEPIRIYKEDDDPPALKTLYDIVRTDSFVVVPLVNAAFIHGLVFVAPLSKGLLQQHDIEFIQAVTEVAGQVMERQWFARWVDRRVNWLEAIVRHTQEGVIYIGENGHVDYINPRFVDLTGIEFDQLINQDEHTVFHALAALGSNKDQTYDRLVKLYASVLSGGDERSTQLQVLGNANNLLFEIVPTMRLDDGQAVWLGLVRESDTSPQYIPGENTNLFKRLPVYIRTYQTRAISLLESLTAHDTYLDDVVRSHMIKSALEEVQHIGNLCDDVLNVASFKETVGSTQSSFIILDHAIEQAIAHLEDNNYRLMFRVQRSEALPKVQVHSEYLLDALQRLLWFIAAESISNSPKMIYFTQRQNFVDVHIMHHLSEGGFQKFEGALQSNYLEGQASEGDLVNGLSIHLANRLIEREMGTLGLEETEVILSLSASTTLAPEEHKPVTVNGSNPSSAEHMDNHREPVSANHRSNPAEANPPGIEPVETIVFCLGTSQIVHKAVDVLRQKGYELSVHRDIRDCLWYIEQENSCDLIILDDHAASDDILSYAQRLRNKANVPVAMMGDNEDLSRAEALRNGIDAYLVEPIDSQMIALEIEALMRRSSRTHEKPITIGDMTIDLSRYTVTLNGEPIDLTRIEYKLLRVLAINSGHVLEHEQLLRQVWGPEYINDKQQLWVYISRLRKKLEPESDGRRYIHTRSGVGYVLK